MGKAKAEDRARAIVEDLENADAVLLYEEDDGTKNLPGGKEKPRDETLGVTAVRETREETDLIVATTHVVAWFLSGDKFEVYFAAEVESGEINERSQYVPIQEIERMGSIGELKSLRILEVIQAHKSGRTPYQISGNGLPELAKK